VGSGLTLTSGNYALAQSPQNATAFSINPVTISIGNVSRNAGAPNPPFTVSYSGVESDYLKQLLSSLVLVTNAPANAAPGTYQINALIPAGMANDIVVQPGNLTITGTDITGAEITGEALLPALLDTQNAPPPSPLATVSNLYNGGLLLPGNAAGQFQVIIMPSADWSAGKVQFGGKIGNALSQASFAETSPDGRPNDNKATYAAGTKK
jgi:hypothetical protein